jgi:hypothetical protein
MDIVDDAAQGGEKGLTDTCKGKDRCAYEGRHAEFKLITHSERLKR